MSYVLDSGLQSFPETHDWHTWLNHTLTSTHSLEEIMARCKEYAPDNDEAATLSFAQMVHNLDPLLEENILNDQLFKDYKPEQLPRGELATLKGLDHFAPWEAPDIVAQTTVEFIDRVVTAESDVGPTM